MSTTVNDAGAHQPATKPAPAAPAPQTHFAIPPLIRRNTWLLALTQAFVGMGNQTAPTLAPIIAVRMLGSADLAGVGTSILGLSRLLIAYPVGFLTDRYGRKAGLMLGLVLTLLGTLVVGGGMLLWSFPVVVIGLVIFGLGVGAGQQLRLAAADMFVPARRGEGLGYVLTGSLVGAIAAPMLIALGRWLATAWGQEELAMVWFMMPIILIPSMLLVLLVRPDPKTIAMNLPHYYPGYVAPSAKAQAATTVSSGSPKVWLQNFPLATAMANSFAALGVMAMMMAMTSLALDHHGYTLTLISVSVSLHVIGMFGFSIPIGRMSDRFGRRNMMLVGNVLLAIGSILVPTSPEYIVITTGTFLVGVGWSCVNVASSALITEVVAPAERGRAIGFTDTVSQASTIILPLSGGPIAAHLGLPALAVVALAVLLLPVIMLSRLREHAPGQYTHAVSSAD